MKDCFPLSFPSDFSETRTKEVGSSTLLSMVYLCGFNQESIVLKRLLYHSVKIKNTSNSKRSNPVELTQ